MAKRWDTDGSQELGRVDTNEESLGACSDTLLLFIVGQNKEKFLNLLEVPLHVFEMIPSKPGEVTGRNPQCDTSLATHL